jgi:hypothetical protein
MIKVENESAIRAIFNIHRQERKRIGERRRMVKKRTWKLKKLVYGCSSRKRMAPRRATG